jgi:phytoene dehydrogenase-like protein
MGGIIRAMALCCAARGVDICKNCAVSEGLIEKGGAASVVTDKGEKLAACALVSDLRTARRFSRSHRLLSQQLGILPHEPRP